MKDLILWILVLLGSFGMIIYLMGKYTDSRTNQIYAQAHLVGAQSSARTDLLAAMMPFVILGLGILVFAIIIILAIIVIVAGAVFIAKLTQRSELEMDAYHQALAAPRQIVINFGGPEVSARKFYKSLPDRSDVIIDM